MLFSQQSMKYISSPDSREQTLVDRARFQSTCVLLWGGCGCFLWPKRGQTLRLVPVGALFPAWLGQVTVFGAWSGSSSQAEGERHFLSSGSSSGSCTQRDAGAKNLPEAQGVCVWLLAAAGE